MNKNEYRRKNKKYRCYHRKNRFRVLFLCILAIGILCKGSVASTFTGSYEPVFAAQETPAVSMDSIPEFSGDAYVIVDNNIPHFENQSTEPFESYSDLDEYGRCGTAMACIGKELMPTEERGKIGMIKPSGWHTVKYAGIDGNYLYNRCHLIGFQLTGENANEKNLITGTRFMNTEGMLPFENMTADYIRDTGHHVMYRVTPVYDGNGLVAKGVHMEAKSVEDDRLTFNVFVYNVQPGISIDYQTGDSWVSRTHD